MKITDLSQPGIGDIVEFETDPETVVEGLIVGETDDGYIYEFSESGYQELEETCTHGKYYCSTDRKWKCRQGRANVIGRLFGDIIHGHARRRLCRELLSKSKRHHCWQF